MSGLSEPILYSFRRCPYAIRARLALAISGVRCEVREVQLRAKPTSMLVASPKGTVPVLVLSDGRVIDESLDIMRWALTHNDPEGWLCREDDALVAENDGPFKRELDHYKYSERYECDPRPHRDRGLSFLRKISARVSVGSQLGGPTRGLTDAAIMPFVRQFAAVDQGWFDAQPLAQLHHWLEDHVRSELFNSVMLAARNAAAGVREGAVRPMRTCLRFAVE